MEFLIPPYFYTFPICTRFNKYFVDLLPIAAPSVKYIFPINIFKN